MGFQVLGVVDGFEIVRDMVWTRLFGMWNGARDATKLLAGMEHLSLDWALRFWGSVGWGLRPGLRLQFVRYKGI